MIVQAIWEKGLSVTDYVETIDEKQKEMQTRIRDVRLTPAECQLFRDYPVKTKVLVMTESWCVDSLMNFPVLVKISHCAPDFDIRVFPRHQFTELREFFETQGISKIPVFLFMNEDFQKIGYWMERPQKAYTLVDQWVAENKGFTDIRQDPSLTREEKMSKLKPYQDKLQEEMWNWYDTGLQLETVREIAKILKIKR